MPRDTAKTVQKVDNKGTDKKKKAPEKKKKKKGNFFKETIQGFKRVTWPTRKELFSATGAVIVFVLAVALLVAGLDEVFRRAMFQPLTGVTRMSIKEKEELKVQQEQLQQQIQDQINAAMLASESGVAPEVIYQDGSTDSDATGTASNITFSSASDDVIASDAAVASGTTVASDQAEATSQEPADAASATTE